jgi:cell wall-associated NlpC family hydrolase
MRQIYRASILCSATCLVVLFANAQDSSPLGDAARQAPQQKQAKTSQPQTREALAAKAPKVITNKEIPQHFKPVADTSAIDQNQGGNSPERSREERKLPPKQWKSQIEQQKHRVSSLQSQIDQLSESIRFAPANCVGNCVQWSERQREKQRQVERMKAQLEDQKKQLEDMQEQARHQGYGSSVYDPD